MKLFLVRHGESEWNKKGLIQGWKNPTLTESGKKDALEAAEKLINKDVDIIISSDLNRAHQTAEIIANRLGKDIIFDWLLRERYHSKLEGKSNKVDWSLYNDHNSKESTESGIESLEHLKNRAKVFLESLSLLPIDVNNVAVVAHGGISNAIMSALNPGHEFSRLQNGEIVEIEVPKDKLMSSNFSLHFDLFEVSCKIVLVNPSKTKVLVYVYKDNSFTLPGGHLQKGEKLADAACREVKEELGIDYCGKLHEIDFGLESWVSERSGELCNKIVLGLVGELDENTKIHHTPDYDDLPTKAKWVDINDIVKSGKYHSHEAYEKIVKKAMEKK